MNKLTKNLALILCLISMLSNLSVHAQPMSAPPQTTTWDQELNSIKEWLGIDTLETNQNIIGKVFINLHEQPDNTFLNVLTRGLSIDELRKLYKTLIEASDYEWTEHFAEKIWQALSLKIKLESTVLYGALRINLIVLTPGERQFVMVLSDGSIWEVADHLSGDSNQDMIIIRDLLGQYTQAKQLDSYENYSYLITALGFPEIRFNGYMLANKTSSLILENKELYWFGELYNSK